MIVLKFGGTSVGNIDRVREAARIIESQPKPRVAVVSAVSGVTNLLLDAARAAAARDPNRAAADVSAIREKHLGIANGIHRAAERLAAVADLGQIHAALNDALEQVDDRGELTAKDSDRIVSTGEKAMSVLMAATLRARGTPAVHLFADQVIGTDDRYGSARPDRGRTREQALAVVRPFLDEGKTVVMTGFIGGAPDGSTTTLGRGGSDYSATLLGAALDADEVQIWTDVPGVLSADPRQVRDARVVPQVSYDEAQELAHFGAKVLHPRTIRPAVAQNIPVRILSTFAPKEPGTLVTRESSGQAVKAVTAMKGLMLLNVDVPELEDLSAAAAATFRVLHEHRIEVVLASQGSSRRRMTYLVDTITGGCARTQELIEEALGDVEATVGCAEDVAVVAAVGQGAAEQASELGRMLGVLERAGVPILAASQQMSNMALVAAVPGRNAERAVDVIHTAFIRPQPGSARGRRPRRAELLAESLRVG
jgi:bifunctional aspartokinase / homoserine dehydrogenase 1